MKSRTTVYWVLGTCAFAAVGLFVVPQITMKISAKMYKANIQKEEVDFNNLGPEIVKKDTTAEEEDA